MVLNPRWGCLGTIFMHWHGAFDQKLCVLFHYLGVFLLAVGQRLWSLDLAPCFLRNWQSPIRLPSTSTPCRPKERCGAKEKWSQWSSILHLPIWKQSSGSLDLLRWALEKWQPRRYHGKMAKLQVTGDMPLLGRCFPCARNLLELQSEDWRWLPLIYHYIFFVSLCMAYIDPQTQKKQVTNEKESAGHCEWMSQFMPAEESIDRMGKGQGMLSWH